MHAAVPKLSGTKRALPNSSPHTTAASTMDTRRRSKRTRHGRISPPPADTPGGEVEETPNDDDEEDLVLDEDDEDDVSSETSSTASATKSATELLSELMALVMSGAVDARFSEDTRATMLCRMRLLSEEKVRQRPDWLKTVAEVEDVAALSSLLDAFMVYTANDSGAEEQIQSRDVFNQKLQSALGVRDIVFLEHQRSVGETLCESTIQRAKRVATDQTSSSAFRLRLVLKEMPLRERTIVATRIRELQLFQEGSQMHEEAQKIIGWLEVALRIPYYHDANTLPREVAIETTLRRLATELDRRIFGMHSVKEQILLVVNSRLRNPEQRGTSLGLIGPPGVGKTTICKILSEVLDVPLRQISFGSVSTDEFLVGSMGVYVGSRPGKIVEELIDAGVSNPIMLLDEYDSVDHHPGVASTMLHVTDPVQNATFRDRYLGSLNVDLSRVWFLYSMNRLPEQSAVRDRFHAVDVPGYSRLEKETILTDYVLPEVLVHAHLDSGDVTIDSEAARRIIDFTGAEDGGIRQLKFCVEGIVERVKFLVQNPNIAAELNLRFTAGDDFTKSGKILPGARKSVDSSSSGLYSCFPVHLTQKFLRHLLPPTFTNADGCNAASMYL